MAKLDEQIEQMMQQAAEQDQAEDLLYGAETSPSQLPRELKDLKKRQEKLKAAMQKLQQIEAARAGRKDLSPKGPAVPLADPDSRVLPNKTGGHAPNYTSVLAVDSDSGLIVDTQVLGSNEEASSVLPAVANIQESFGQKPAQVAADSGFNTGSNLSGLHEQHVQALMPPRQEVDQNNSALREDHSVAVAPEARDALPMNPQNKVLDKAAFLYNPAKDQYHCPMGQVLSYEEDKPYNRSGTKGTYRIYECNTCAGCPLASRCLPKNATGRRISRDEHEALREQMAQRLKSDEGKAQYKRRAHAAETPFAVLKSRMNLRQFLHRGLEKVGLELRWAATAYNVVKLIRLKAAASLAPAPAIASG
jgi:hypothetical protein